MVLPFPFSLAFSFCLALACSNTFHHFLPLDLLIFSTPTASTNLAHLSFPIYLNSRLQWSRSQGPLIHQSDHCQVQPKSLLVDALSQKQRRCPHPQWRTRKTQFQRVVMYKSAVSYLNHSFVKSSTAYFLSFSCYGLLFILTCYGPLK